MGSKMVVSTGVNVDKQTFTWRIKDFDVILHSDELIKAQEFTFKAGELIGLETEWRVYLEVDNKNQVVGIFLSCAKKPNNVKQVNGIAQFSIVSANDKDNRATKFGDLKPQSMIDYIAKRTSGYPKFIPKDGNTEDLPLVDGVLVVEIQFHLYAPTPPPAMLKRTLNPIGTGSVEEQFKPIFMEKLQSDLKGLDIAFQTSDPRVKIVSKDKKEFEGRGGTLSVRSPVFKRMLEVDMKEANMGIISIDDLSSKTIAVLLRFIYTGTLHEDWSSPDVIVQLVYAAEKYELSDLLDLLDNALGKACSKENAGKLLNLAKKLGMKKAEHEVLERMKKDFSNNDDILAVISSGCELDF